MILSSRAKGVVFILLAACGLSLGGLLVRHADASAWEIVFWRSVTMSLVLVAFLGHQHGWNILREVRRTGWAGLLCGCFLAATFFCFVAAVQSTTVANTVVIMSTTPFFAAVFGRLVLGEAVGRRTWIALAVSAVGVTIMCWDSLDTDHGMTGNLFALGLALSYAAHLVTLRAVGGRVDMVAKLKSTGSWAVVDFKTQKVKRDAKGALKPTFYEAWPLQLEAYRQAILAEAARKQPLDIVSLSISSIEPVPVMPKVWPREEQTAYYRAFLNARNLWVWMKGYCPIESPVA